EALGKPVHRASHHLVDIHLFDVVARDEAHDIVEYLQVLVRVLAPKCLAENTTDERKRDDRCRNEEDDAACGGRHKAIYSLQFSVDGSQLSVNGSRLEAQASPL